MVQVVGGVVFVEAEEFEPLVQLAGGEALSFFGGICGRFGAVLAIEQGDEVFGGRAGDGAAAAGGAADAAVGADDDQSAGAVFSLISCSMRQSASRLGPL